MPRPRAVLTALLLPGALYAASLPPLAPQPDPAEELIREAASRSPAMLEQELHITQADAFRFRGWRQYMPYVSANYQAGYFNLLNSPGGADDEGKIGGSYTLSAHHPVYHWGAIDAEKKFAFARENLARTEARISWRSLVTEIRTKFLDAVVNKARVALLERRVKWSHERLEASRQELKLGRIVQAELTAVALDSRNAELELTRSKIALATQLSQLRSLTGVDNYGVENLPDDLPVITWNDSLLEQRLHDFVTQGESESPENRRAGYANEVYNNQMIMAEAREKPQFNLGGAVSQTPIESNGSFGMQTYLFVGIMGTWNIFDRDTTRENVRAINVARRLVEAKRTTGLKQRHTDLTNALVQIKASRESLSIRTDIVKLRQDAYDAIRHRHELGLGKREEVTLAEDALLEARLARLADIQVIQNAYHTFMNGILLSPSDSFYIAPANGE